MKLYQAIKNWIVPVPKYLYQTHAHTDHILWLPHVIRAVNTPWSKILCSNYVKDKIEKLFEWCEMTGRYAKKHKKWVRDIQTIKHNEQIDIYDWKLNPIDLESEKAEQHWFVLNAEWKKIVFFGDENIWVVNREDLNHCLDSDLLILEAFCLDREKEVKDPYGKHHITAKDAGEFAKKMNAKSVVIIHLDQDLNIDRSNYLNEVKKEVEECCDAKVYVPKDDDEIEL